MKQEWSNWSGSLRFRPGRIGAPQDEEELADLVRRAAAENRTVRVAGAGHSSSPLVQTEGILVSMKEFKGLESHDSEAREATLRAGITLKEAGKSLLDLGLAMENLGDVDLQSLVGAVGTGTHGTGKRLKILSAHLIGVRMVIGTGDIVEVSYDDDPELIKAARVSLGVLGIFTSLTLRLSPAFKLHRRECCTHIDDCLINLDKLMEENRNFDFYWYPRSDLAKVRIMNPPGEGPEDIPYARCDKERLAGAPMSFRDIASSNLMRWSIPCRLRRDLNASWKCESGLRKSTAKPWPGAFCVEPLRETMLT
jgi:FAD/FMN-containing dehydrogenase